jgi:lactate racemase
MLVHFPYGKRNLAVNLPDNCHSFIVEPLVSQPLNDSKNELLKTLEDPIGSPSIRSIIKPSDKVGIIFNDITRPTPSGLILHTILQELSNIPHQSVTLFNALGDAPVQYDCGVTSNFG